jgi:addiction module HigA family antidote
MTRAPQLTPAEKLKRDWLLPKNLSMEKLARALNISVRTVGALFYGKGRITPLLAMRLARYWKNNPEYWLELQMRWDLSQEQEKSQDMINREVRPRREW